MDVATLAEQLDVTPETLRRDLTVLEFRDFLRRVHGGAVAVESVAIEQTFEERESVNAESTTGIARAAHQCNIWQYLCVLQTYGDH